MDYSHSDFSVWVAGTIGNAGASVGIWSFKLGESCGTHIRIAGVPRLGVFNAILAGSKAGSKRFLGSKGLHYGKRSDSR